MTEKIVQRRVGIARRALRGAMRLSAVFFPRGATVRQTIFNGMPLLVWANEYIGRRILTTGSFEKDDLARLGSFVGPGDTCIDIGGNIGIYALALAKLVGPEGRVVAFEPVKRNAILIELNCALNEFTNVAIERAPLSDTAGIPLSMSVPENDSAYSFFTDRGGAGDVVVSDRLDDYCARHQLGKISFIKIDIEGAEFNALRGAEALLTSSNRPDVLMVEMVDEYLQRFGTDTTTVCAWMRERGYVAHAVRDDQLVPVDAATIDTENVVFRYLA